MDDIIHSLRDRISKRDCFIPSHPPWYCNIEDFSRFASEGIIKILFVNISSRFIWEIKFEDIPNYFFLFVYVFFPIRVKGSSDENVFSTYFPRFFYFLSKYIPCPNIIDRSTKFHFNFRNTKLKNYERMCILWHLKFYFVFVANLRVKTLAAIFTRKHFTQYDINYKWNIISIIIRFHRSYFLLLCKDLFL